MDILVKKVSTDIDNIKNPSLFMTRKEKIIAWAEKPFLPVLGNSGTEDRSRQEKRKW